MGKYGAFDLYVAPLLRDSTIFVPMLAFWFLVHWFSRFFYTFFFGAVFKRLSAAKQDDVLVRTVSILNGLLMTGSSACFLSNVIAHNFTIPDDYYAVIPGYRFFRISIVTYFVWDIIICYVYKWDTVWKIHAFASFTGAYFLSFPFSDYYGSYFTGMFELSNAPLHASVILRTLDVPRLLPFATLLEGLFALLFIFIRVMGGSMVTWNWLRLTCANLIENYNSGGTVLHGEVPVVISMLLIVVVQLLQYFWLIDIGRRIIAFLSPAKNVKQKVKTV